MNTNYETNEICIKRVRNIHHNEIIEYNTFCFTHFQIRTEMNKYFRIKIIREFLLLEQFQLKVICFIKVNRVQFSLQFCFCF